MKFYAVKLWMILTSSRKLFRGSITFKIEDYATGSSSFFSEELDLDYSDISYFSSVCWLSRANTLKRFWNLRNEIKSYLESKNQNVSFLSDIEWLNDLLLLTDVTQHLSKIDKQLQRRNQLANTMFKPWVYWRRIRGIAVYLLFLVNA